MGNQESGEVNYAEYGMDEQEVKNLHQKFNEHTGTFSPRLNHDEFKELFLELFPEEKGGLFRGGLWSEHEKVNKAFEAADTNHDGKISFDEFRAFYLLHRSPQYFNSNVKNFLNQAHGNDGFIRSDQAYKYANYIHNYYGNPNDVQSPNDFVRQFQDQYKDQIPINDFGNGIAKNYNNYNNY